MLENFDWIRDSERLKEIIIKIFVVIFVVIIALVLSIFYINYRNQKNQEGTKKQEQFKKEALQLEQTNSEYIEAMNLICSKQVTKLAALDFYRCKIIKEDSYIDLKLELENPELPSFCQRKVQELTANEFSECLEEKSTP